MIGLAVIGGAAGGAAPDPSRSASAADVPLEFDEGGVELKSRKEYLGTVEGCWETLGSKRTERCLLPSLEILREPSVGDIAEVDAESLRDDPPDRRQNLVLILGFSSTGVGSSYVR